MKRIKQLLLTIALVLWSVAGNAVNYFYEKVYNEFGKPIYEIGYHYIGDDKVEVESINMYDLYTDRLIDPIPSTAYYKYKFYRVTAIAEGAFIDYDDMIDITFPNSVTIIKDKAFYNASGLWNVNIPNSVTNIGRYAFACTDLRSITIPNSVTTIGTGAFSGCTKLEGITIEHGATTIVDSMFMNCTALRSITIPNSVTTIGEGAFKNCTNLRSITIPNSVTTIGKGAFDGCTDLTSIAIPNSVTNIGRYAFANCTNLRSITIPNSVTTIGEGAFKNCTNLRSITIPNSVTTIGEDVFFSDDIIIYNFSNVEIPNAINISKSIVIEDFVFGRIKGKNTLHGYIGNNKQITLPKNCDGEDYVIGKIAFSNRDEINVIIIPNSVTMIGEEAFYGCSDSLLICNCSNIEFTTNILNKGKVINVQEAFITEDFVFGKINDKNTLLRYIGNNKQITLPENCNGENYVIGKKIFEYCNNITSITIPNSVTIIEKNAFSGCTGLKNITIPNSVKLIKSHAFYDCSSLSSIYLLGTKPPQLNNKNVFPESLYSNAVLYIPEGSLATYKAANLWKHFWNIQEYDVTTVENVEEDTPAYETTSTGIQFTNADGKIIAIYTINGALIEKIDSYAGEEIMLDKGVYIFRVGNKTMKVRL